LIGSAIVIVFNTGTVVAIKMGTNCTELWFADTSAGMGVPNLVGQAGVSMVDALAHAVYVVPEEAWVAVCVVGTLTTAGVPVELVVCVTNAIASAPLNVGVPDLVEIARNGNYATSAITVVHVVIAVLTLFRRALACNDWVRSSCLREFRINLRQSMSMMV
jgi:hypothetical protein